jgi:hypothetical protein
MRGLVIQPHFWWFVIAVCFILFLLFGNNWVT